MKIERIAESCYVEGTELYAEEKEETGKARVKIKLPEKGFLFQYDHRIGFVFKHKKRADGILFAKTSEDWNLLIIEIKKTIGSSEWKKIKEQWYGAWLHTKALSGILEISFLEKVRFVVAYEKERIIGGSADPVLLKRQIQEKYPKESKKYSEWKDARHI